MHFLELHKTPLRDLNDSFELFIKGWPAFCEEIEKTIEDLKAKGFQLEGGFPSIKQLHAIGRSDLKNTIVQKYGGFREVRKRLNLKKIQLDENYFEKIDTKEKAYWLGYLYADGWMYVRKNKPNIRQLGIEIHKRDEAVIDKFLFCLKAKGIKKLYRKNNDMVYIKIGNKKLTADLLKHGVIPNKSKVIEFPSLQSRQLELAFVLGYFDGDGKKGSNRIASGSKKFLEQIKNKFHLKSKIIMQKTKGITYRLFLGAELFNQMMINYQHSLPAKRRRFLTREEKLEKFIEGGIENRGEKKLFIEKEKLKKLVWQKPTSQIAVEYGVTPGTIAKRCRKWNIPKPPRGYWTGIKNKNNK